MPLPPITAQIIPDLPPGLTQLGMAGIFALALWGLVRIIRPLLTAYIDARKDSAEAQKQLVNVNTQLLAVIDRNTAQSERTAAQIGAFEASITKLAEAQATLVKALPDTIAQFVKATESAADRTIKTVTDASVAREGEIIAGLARVEASIESLRTEIASGQKAHRAEVLGKIDKVLLELSAMKPVPPTPPTAMHLVPKPEEEAA